MATPPGNGNRNVNSLMMEIALHLVEPCVIATTTSLVSFAGLQSAGITSTVGMYVGAMAVVANSDATNPTILVITAFDPVALTVTGNFLAAYAIGSTIQGGTFPTQQPSDPLFTQQEIMGYIARAQNEFLAKIPCIFQFFESVGLTTGQTFYSLPATAIELERVAIESPQVTANIVSILRVGGYVSCVLDGNYGITANATVVVAGVADSTFDGTFTSLTVSADGLTITWNENDANPDAASTGGTLSYSILTRLYEVSQQELTMRDPQWFYNTSNPLPTSWYEDRTGVYGWGVAGVPQSSFDVELMCSVRDSETLLLTDHFLVPDLCIHIVKYGALQYIWSKEGEQASPTMARIAGSRFDRGIIMVDRYLRNFIEATQQR